MPKPPRRSNREDSPEGRVRAVEVLLDENERALIGYAARLLGGDVDRARDVVQEAFLRLCKQRSLDGLGREWLFRVTRNLCVDAHRKESRMNTFENDGAVHALKDESPPPGRSHEDREQLAHAIDRLPDKQQEVLRLKFDSGLSYAEIARVMETNAGTVGWLLHTAIQGLKERMVPEGGAR